MVILAAASMTIVTYGKDENIVNQLYGIVLLPVSVAFMFYAAWQYLRRSYMIKNHTPGECQVFRLLMILIYTPRLTTSLTPQVRI